MTEEHAQNLDAVRSTINGKDINRVANNKARISNQERDDDPETSDDGIKIITEMKFTTADFQKNQSQQVKC